ncbi:hypothetical protein JAAARDRAFT_50074 [Jaapia argillacea MUCL 33604]|uniref:DDE Tnp4 domain-containing protein n=1 Tax=Jaapia argillacea MUCL 33604 TaxID=933084 RepID=A0A067PD60_9AGAM|nr:hypothetical protein JAAARDRAFT_50074 [Jaapia argillacea MUCL 33604]
MRDVSLQEIFALVPSTTTRYLDFSMAILLDTLQHMEDGCIAWTTGSRLVEDNRLIVARHSRLKGGFGSTDGLGLPVTESDDPEIENTTYNGWKSAHFVSNVFAFSPRGEIIHAILNAPGSWHDSHVARPLFEKLRTSTPDGYYLIADSAFPRGTAAIQGKIQAPLKSGSHITDDVIEQVEILQFNRELLSYRQTAEWGMRMMQGSFARLCLPLDINDPDGRQRLLEIRNVYMPIWRETEDDEMWDSLGNMVFWEICHCDHVSRYHLTIAREE